MNQFLYQYELNPVTWVYISSLMTIAIFFKFTRFWSIRNLDLVGLICLAPGLLLVSHGESVEQIVRRGGYAAVGVGHGEAVVVDVVGVGVNRRGTTARSPTTR